MKRIESIVHPLVADKRKEFYNNAVSAGDLLVVYDIPLLFENRLSYDVDYIVVATADEAVQKARVMQRKGTRSNSSLVLQL